MIAHRPKHVMGTKQKKKIKTLRNIAAIDGYRKVIETDKTECNPQK
jgi:hypothetical protein